MKLSVRDELTHVATGGKEFDSTQPAVLFLHGSGLDHRSWALQTRWFAYNGFSVLAPDFPGHSLSAGKPLESIEEMGAWLDDLLEVAAVESAHLVGHSQGYLCALELAKQAPSRIRSLTGIATAAAIPVNPMLIETAVNNAGAAADMMLQWGFGNQIHMGHSPTPGMQPIAAGRQIMAHNPLATDLRACAEYSAGDGVAQTLKMPSCLILAGEDRMTPLKSGLALGKLLGAEVQILEDYGHMLPMEAPKAVLKMLREFISKH